MTNESPTGGILWYYTNEQNQAIGPVSTDDLKKLALAKTISDATYVIEVAGSNWRSYGELFKSGSPVNPPPLPPSLSVDAKKPSKQAVILTWVLLAFSAFTVPFVGLIAAFFCRYLPSVPRLIFMLLAAFLTFSQLISYAVHTLSAANSQPEASPVIKESPQNSIEETTSLFGGKENAALSQNESSLVVDAKESSELQAAALREKVETMVAGLESMLANVENDSAARDFLPRDIAKWNKEASSIRDAVYDFVKKSASPFNSLGSSGRPLQTAAMYMQMAGLSSISDISSGRENIRLARMTLAQFQSNLNAPKASEQATSGQLDEARQVSMNSSTNAQSLPRESISQLQNDGSSVSSAPAVEISLEQQARAFRENVENLVVRLDSMLANFENDSAARDSITRNIAKWNREAISVRDAVYDFVKKSDSPYNSFGSLGRPLETAAMYMQMAGVSSIADIASGRDNIRLARISLAQFQSNLNSQILPEQPASEQSNEARQIFKQVMNASEDKRDALIKQAADMGYWEAQLRHGNQLASQRDWAGALEYMMKAAEQGSLDAMNNCGYMYSGQTGMTPNGVESIKWYRIGEIVNLEPTPNVMFVKKRLNMTSAEIEAAELAAKKWVADHPNVKRTLD